VHAHVDLLADAIVRAVKISTGLPGWPSAKDLSG